MIRSIKTLFLLCIGSWFSLVAAQQSLALPTEKIRIADFGLESRIPSAIDLVGPDLGPAGRNRAALARRLQCWIDGIENCSFADRNDARVRAVRRFLGFGPADQHGTVIVHFPDQTRIAVGLVRAPESDIDAWMHSAYQPVVLPDTAQAPGLPAVPSTLAHFDALDYDGTPAVRAALERLKRRLKTSNGSAQAVPAANWTDRRSAFSPEPPR